MRTAGQSARADWADLLDEAEEVSVAAEIGGFRDLAIGKRVQMAAPQHWGGGVAVRLGGEWR